MSRSLRSVLQCSSNRGAERRAAAMNVHWRLLRPSGANLSSNGICATRTARAICAARSRMTANRKHDLRRMRLDLGDQARKIALNVFRGMLNKNPAQRRHIKTLLVKLLVTRFVRKAYLAVLNHQHDIRWIDFKPCRKIFAACRSRGDDD